MRSGSEIVGMKFGGERCVEMQNTYRIGSFVYATLQLDGREINGGTGLQEDALPLPIASGCMGVCSRRS